MAPGTLWFGWSGRRSSASAAHATQIEAGGVTYATIDLSEEAYQSFYVGFANGALWPLFHFRLDLMRFQHTDYLGYLSVNRLFARSLALLLQPDDIVWVHDYHLIPLGQMLREQGFAGRIGFFLHVPFVPPALLATLPVGKEIMSALGAYDLLGFQTDEHALDFRDCAARFLSAQCGAGHVRQEGRSTRVITNPIGIDAVRFSRDAERAAGRRALRRLPGSLGGKSLAIGVDRLDYSKGLTQRFNAYMRLLELHPEHRRRISFLQICPSSRQDVAEYRRLRTELDSLAEGINGTYAEPDWTPLHCSPRAAPRRILAGLYRRARIGLVTPLRDGMNLVAKEFVAAQADDDPGVLILSRFAGAAQELTEALIVNPFDADQVAQALDCALRMPLSERKARHSALKDKVRRTSAQAYRRQFIDALEGCSFIRAVA